MKFKRLSDNRNTLVFFLIVKQPWNSFRLSKHPNRYNSDISTHQSVRLICVPENSAGGENEWLICSQDGSTQQFVGLEPTLGSSEQNITPKIMGRLFNSTWHCSSL